MVSKKLKHKEGLVKSKPEAPIASENALIFCCNDRYEYMATYVCVHMIFSFLNVN